MIESDEQLRIAQGAVQNLQQILLAARRAHTPAEYRQMSAPILLEIQQREQEVLAYLATSGSEDSPTKIPA